MIGWHYGFGLAAVFMILGALQFWLAQGIFGDIGGAPGKDALLVDASEPLDDTPAHVVRDRLIAIGVFSFFTIFFWFAFEQAGGSMTIFAADYTDRALVGTSGLIFKIVNSLMTLIPVAILSLAAGQAGPQHRGPLQAVQRPAGAGAGGDLGPVAVDAGPRVPDGAIRRFRPPGSGC